LLDSLLQETKKEQKKHNVIKVSIQSLKYTCDDATFQSESEPPIFICLDKP